MLNREEIDAGGPMPRTKALKPEVIDIWRRWIMAGMPNTAADAAAASPAAPSGGVTTTVTVPVTVTVTTPVTTTLPVETGTPTP